ncbi:MAG TPA: ATP-binding protein [Candidatus Norongarragalinales archaeon]|jgi:hypothetical protein|nr:ATP-binding protein [Candidatus Norongarragalinales archaeon]
MTQVFEAKEKLLEQLGWSENPFVKDLRQEGKDAFLKYYAPLDGGAILERLAFDSKACLLLGPKGVGKTSALYFVFHSLPSSEFLPVFFKEPPRDLEGLQLEAGLAKQPGFFDGLVTMVSGKRRVTRKEVHEKVKALPKKVVWFVDEAHLAADKNFYMEMKYALDECPNLRLVISALGKEHFPDSLTNLVGNANTFQRTKFTKEEMMRIIEHRIDAVGGKGHDPFPQTYLDEVLTEQNLLSPRYVFDQLNQYLAKVATGKATGSKVGDYRDNPIVQSAINLSRKQLTTSNAPWWPILTPSQQNVLDLLLRSDGGLTLADIMGQSSLPENTAFNVLYQLRGDDKAEIARKPEVPFPLVAVEKRRVGGRKKNVYAADAKIRNLFTLH